MSDPAFDLARFEAECARRELTLGRAASWRDETTSTNDDALAAAKSGAAHGTLFGAEKQTRGRGRRGSEWISTPGAGLWFSLLLRPELSAELAPGLALCAGLAVREAVATRVRVPALVKWPNDVLAGGRKLAGVLVESQVTGNKITSVIVGIGINVTQTEFPEPISKIATSLALLSASNDAREPLLADVLASFAAQLEHLATQGMAGIAEVLRPHDALFGRRLRVEAVEGTGAGIDTSGRLLVRSTNGQLRSLASGHIELL
jgi:BirA family transcriptional regulator, biotin operon repressor / biotin---[acetyl-CoA-carboxylase] ligase